MIQETREGHYDLLSRALEQVIQLALGIDDRPGDGVWDDRLAGCCQG
jgi:hypothetical protein